MPDEIVGRLSIETDPDAYSSLWDDSWANKLDEVVGEANLLRQHVMDLLLTWKAANHTHAAPFVLLSSVHYQFNPDEVESLAMRVCARIKRQVGKLRLPREQFQQVQLAVEDVAASVKHIERKSVVPRPRLWANYFEELPFQLHIWGTQRLAYVAVWDGYEAFVKAIVKSAAPTIKKDREAFKEAFVEHFGALYNDCWATEPNLGHPVNVGRVVRNALCHAGGRGTPHFQALPLSAREQFSVVENKIQIWPTNTRNLFNALKGHVLALATKAVTLPSFS